MKYNLLALLFSLSITISGQKLIEHQWKNRIIVFVSNDKESIESNYLINEIENDIAGLRERRLIIYKVLPKSYSINSDHFDSKKLYDSLNPKKNNFKFILIGLDGRIKVEQSKPLSKKELYTIIDAMPMRRGELKDN